MDELLTINETAALLNMSVSAVRALENDNRLVPTRTEGQHRKYYRSEVIAYLIKANPIDKRHALMEISYYGVYLEVCKLPDGSFTQRRNETKYVVEGKWRQENYFELVEAGEAFVNDKPLSEFVPEKVSLNNYPLADGQSGCLFSISIVALTQAECEAICIQIVPKLEAVLAKAVPQKGIVYWELNDEIGRFCEAMGEWTPEPNNYSLRQMD